MSKTSIRKAAAGLVLLCAASILLLSCGGDPYADSTIDVALCAAALNDAAQFDDELVPLDQSAVDTLYAIDGAAQIVVYAGSGATAEEIILVEAAGAEEAKIAEASLQSLLSDRIKRFEDYNPAELVKLNNPVLLRRGNYVIYCISNAYDSAVAEIESWFAAK